MTHKKIVILLFFFINAVTIYSEVNVSHRFLILHSYSSKNSWSSNINNGILDTLKQDFPNACYNVEFMDTQFSKSEYFYDTFYKLITDKYRWMKFDGIIVSDDNALDFIMKYWNQGFPNVPIIACGINEYNYKFQNPNLKSIILERPDYWGNMHQILKIFPEAASIHLILGSDLADKTFQIFKLSRENSNNSSIDFSIMTDSLFPKLKNSVAALPDDSVLFLAPYSIDGRNNLYSEGKAEQELSDVSKNPIFVGWDNQLGTGALGGSVIDSYRMGTVAMKTMTGYLLEGKAKQFIFNYEDMYKTIYDYEVLRKFGIDPALLPDDAVLINKEPSFLYHYRFYFVLIILMFVFLGQFLHSTVRGLKRVKIINVQKEEIIELGEEFIETQNQIITTLGEVIEKRSKETSTHVKRVSEISGFIAWKLGMSEVFIQNLKAASPMHDIGKIGIPDSILQKPGKLTSDEFEIIKTHTTISRDILSNSDRTLFQSARTIACSHHEFWDGTGYPDGLQGNEIPLLARITAVADVYDALISNRHYKKGWDQPRVLKYLERESGKQFDPLLVQIFLENIDEINRINIEVDSQYAAPTETNLI
jgi:HD-GYP domain-containing protein (c-di-GMP phosphodiesterase class II)